MSRSAEREMLLLSASSMLHCKNELRSISVKIRPVNEESVEMSFFKKVMARWRIKLGTSELDTRDAIWLLITEKNWGLMRQVR